MRDQLYSWMFDDAPVRGEVVSIQRAWQHIGSLHHYPHAVTNVLGEMLAAAALLSSTLKFDGSLVIQVLSNGPVKLLVAESNSLLGLRATAKLASDDVEIATDTSLQQLINHDGNARMMITLDPREKLPGQRPYQGIIPVEGDTMAQLLENYMLRSEQIDTRLWLACDVGNSTGFIMQRIPIEGGHSAQTEHDDGAWEHLLQLCATLKREELLTLSPQEIIKRLFWNEKLRLFEPRSPHFFCTCSRERVANMLRTLGREEVDSIITEIGQIQVNCEYCRTRYAFDKVDAAQLFVNHVNDIAGGIH